MGRLANKAALITGAARGIGFAFAKAYVAEGARVAIADIDEARAQEAASALGEAAIAVEMDVTDQASIDAGVAATVEAFGQIDILINNAACSPPHRSSRYRARTMPAPSTSMSPVRCSPCRRSRGT
jgi:NAD(P)-dependent dehydrogenase (short-subunit alcohol dehydrogenase family)